MTFEDWYAIHGSGWTREINLAKQAWDAATYAANTRAGDASNEAEKEARRKVAVDEIGHQLLVLALGSPSNEAIIKKLDAIIKAAQG
jgi:hypothetical protein